MRFHAADGTEHTDRAIEHPQRSLDLDGEVNMSRGVDDVDAVLRKLAVHTFPEARRRGGRYGYATLLLLLHPIHDCGAVMHFAKFVRDTRIVEDALGSRGLAGIDVRHDANVAVVFEGR